jgi:hypothetical protein
MLTLKRFIQRFPGSSIPSLVETTDGQTLVLKMKGAGNGTQSLAAEFLVNRSALRLGWPLPGAFPVLIPDGFPWEFGTDEFDDILQKSYGLNLGLQYLGDCEALSAEKMLALPGDFLSQMATLDAFFLNYDRLGASRNVLRDAQGAPWLIDHGSCLFLDPDLSAKPLVLAPGHVLGAQAPIRPRAALRLGEQALLCAAEVPGPWLAELGLTTASVQEAIEARLRAAAAAPL